MVQLRLQEPLALAALAAIAGVVFVIATYGDKIVAWAKKLLGKCECRSPAEDGFELMRILDAAYESARTGHEVAL